VAWDLRRLKKSLAEVERVIVGNRYWKKPKEARKVYLLWVKLPLLTANLYSERAFYIPLLNTIAMSKHTDIDLLVNAAGRYFRSKPF